MLLNTLGFQLKGFDRVRAIHKLTQSIEKDGDRTGKKASILLLIKNNQNNNDFCLLQNNSKDIILNNNTNNKTILNDDLISNNISKNNDYNTIDNKTSRKNNYIINSNERAKINKKYIEEILSEQRASHKFYQLGKNELISKFYKLSPRRHLQMKEKNNNNKIILRNKSDFNIFKINKNFSAKNSSTNKNFFCKKYNVTKKMKLKKNQSQESSENFEKIPDFPKFARNSQISIKLPKISKISLIDKIYLNNIKNLYEGINQDYLGDNNYIFVKNNLKQSISKIFMNNRLAKDKSLNSAKPAEK